MGKLAYCVSIDCPQLSRRFERLIIEADNADEAKTIAAAQAIRDSRSRGISPLLAGLSREEALRIVAKYATVGE